MVTVLGKRLCRSATTYRTMQVRSTVANDGAETKLSATEAATAAAAPAR